MSDTPDSTEPAKVGREALEKHAEKVLERLGYCPEANIKMNWLDVRNVIVAALAALQPAPKG